MKNPLAVLCLCAAPLLAQAQAQNCTGDNADGNYILGEAEGTASAMHWPENGACGSAHTTEADAPLLADAPTALCNACAMRAGCTPPSPTGPACP